MTAWIDALREWNGKNGGMWCLPRKGTKEHAEVMAIVANKKAAPKAEPKAAPKAEPKAAPKAEPKAAPKAEPKKKEPKAKKEKAKKCCGGPSDAELEKRDTGISLVEKMLSLKNKIRDESSPEKKESLKEELRETIRKYKSL